MEFIKKKHKYRSYTYSFRSSRYKRNKADWNGSSLADAFRPNLSSTCQMAPRKKLWDVCHNLQMKVVKYLHGESIQVKPQVAHFYLLPPVLAALSCIGLTTFLEAKEQARTRRSLLEVFNAGFINAPESLLDTRQPAEVLKKLALMIARVIDNRMIIQILHKKLNIEYVEMYRVISSSMIDLDGIYSLEQCLTLNLIYGDLIVPEKDDDSATATLWRELNRFNEPYLKNFGQLSDTELLSAAADWHLLLTQEVAQKFSLVSNRSASQGNHTWTLVDTTTAGKTFGNGEKGIWINSSDAALHINDPGAFLALDEEGARSIFSTLGEEDQRILKEVALNVHQASRDSALQSQLSSNGLLDVLRKDLWSRTPLEGTPTEGKEINLDFGGYKMSDVVYDKPLDLSYDFTSVNRIRELAGPITRQLNRILYVSPGVESTHILASSGANFNSASLPTYQVAENLFSRSKDQLSLNTQGESIVVLAADTSGSNSRDQIDCVKILSASWIATAKTRKNRIEFIGATYDSGNNVHHGTMVRWIYHDRINESRTFEHALQRVDSIVSNGANSDVKSWARILEEVEILMKSKPRLWKAHIYLILISDCAFNKSFNGTPFSTASEVKEYIQSVKKGRWKDRIHITLVSLSNQVSALDQFVDLRLTITNNEMQSPAHSAREISAFVSKAIKQQREKLKP